MKEPDKWCIKITPENREAIEKWRTASAISECKGYCVNKNSLNSSIGYWYSDKPRGYTEISFEEFKIYTSKPLKQAVHCTTQEEWDFVKNKINGYSDWEEDYPCQILVGEIPWKGGIQFCIDKGIQILSFQEWCSLNGYKMKKETMFEPGKWYSFYWTWHDAGLVIIKVLSENDNNVNVSQYYRRGSFYGESKFDYAFELSEIKDIKELSIEEIQQYLPDNHPDKIKLNKNFQDGDWVFAIGNIQDYDQPTIGKINKFSIGDNYDSRVDFYSKNGLHCTIWSNVIRHATPEEIHRHLVFTGQIPAEKYPFKKLEEDDLTWEIKTEGIRWTESVSMTNENWKPKMILSIDDEELSMVNIIKTNTVKQLLNNE